MTAIRLSVAGACALAGVAAYLWWNHPPNFEAARRRRSWYTVTPTQLHLNDQR